jgi:S-adenosylmethionine:tRNA ribosyltransferase-isomerase
MLRPGRKLRPGDRIETGGEIALEVLGGEAPGDGLRRVRVHGAPAVIEALERQGEMPLPPYIRRAADEDDRERYQTVFARAPGAVAAPTAGLHFSQALLAELRARGVEIATLTLHVGPGTFRPVSVADLDDHPMHAEPYEVGDEVVRAVAAARERGASVIAVGTTVVRALESAADAARAGQVRAARGETRLLIQPGYPFRVVDGLLTNFHLPGSTLLALVYAFGGSARVASAYREAIAEGYRFYSYGDAMYLPPQATAAGAGR